MGEVKGGDDDVARRKLVLRTQKGADVAVLVLAPGLLENKG